MTTPDILSALNPVITAFENLSIQHYIGGSIASSIYGMARTTMDIDIVADCKIYHVSALKQLLENNYYVDENMMLEAIRTKTSFNLIHSATTLKIDIFIYDDDPFQRSAIDRKVKDKLDEEHDSEYYFSSPEDTIIAKLQWYDQGNSVSERKWLDIIGIMKVQAQRLDQRYLEIWSKRLGFYDLLKKTLADSGLNIQ